MNKNLVYFCVFYNKDYFKLLNLLLTSLKFFSTVSNFDLLIITNDNMIDNVKELENNLQLNLKIKTFNFTTIFQAACARLFIFDYEEIDKYEKILYLDTDIIIKKDLAKIFDLQIDDVLYGIESGTINSPSFGNQFFDFKKFDRSIKGINSGTLLFNNIQTIRNLFSKIN
jgi:lipopolysaccharide biosynthesis glycosyltransferase